MQIEHGWNILSIHLVHKKEKKVVYKKQVQV